MKKNYTWTFFSFIASVDTAEQHPFAIISANFRKKSKRSQWHTQGPGGHWFTTKNLRSKISCQTPLKHSLFTRKRRLVLHAPLRFSICGSLYTEWCVYGNRDSVTRTRDQLDLFTLVKRDSIELELVTCLHWWVIKLMRCSLVDEWLEHLTAIAEVPNSPGFDPSILRHSGIWGAADEAVLNTVYKKNPKNPPVNETDQKACKEYKI